MPASAAFTRPKAGSVVFTRRVNESQGLALSQRPEISSTLSLGRKVFPAMSWETLAESSSDDVVDAAAALAVQEGGGVLCFRCVGTGDIGVLARETVRQALLDQEVAQGAVDRDRGEPAALREGASTDSWAPSGFWDSCRAWSTWRRIGVRRAPRRGTGSSAWAIAVSWLEV